jgi:hypothetical protein
VAVLVVGMEVSRRSWVRFFEFVGLRDEKQRAGYRSTMRGARAGLVALWLGRNLGFEEDVEAHSIRRAVGALPPDHRDLRAHPRPILPLSLVALGRRWRRG